MPEWEQIVSELERATAKLAAAETRDLISLAQAMNERSLAVARLREAVAQPAAPVPPTLLDRIKSDIEAGAALAQRLLLLRAALRQEMGRVREDDHFLRSVPTATRPAACLDCKL